MGTTRAIVNGRRRTAKGQTVALARRIRALRHRHHGRGRCCLYCGSEAVTLTIDVNNRLWVRCTVGGCIGSIKDVEHVQ
jgi:hypothetical protein